MPRQRIAGRVTPAALVVLAGLAGALTVASPAGAQSFIPELRKALFDGLIGAVGSIPNPNGGGFTYRFDPTIGTFTRSTEDFGPLFSDRADTTGRGRFTLGASYSRYRFDEVDGVSLDSGDLSALAVAVEAPQGTRLSVLDFRQEVEADVFTLGALYGVTDDLDVGLTLPIIKVRVGERPRRIGFQDCGTPVAPNLSNCAPAVARIDELLPSSAESTGIGDIVLRAKYRVWQQRFQTGARLGVAGVLDLKLPTGDEGERRKFVNPALIDPATGQPTDSVQRTAITLADPPLGTGVFRVKPQIVASGSWLGISPHVNLGVELGTTEGVTNDLVYAVGVEYTVFGRVTLLADLLGRHAFNVERSRIVPGGLGGTADPDTVTASFGLKANPIGTLLVFLNFQIPLTDTGLRADVVPTFGLEWSF